MKKWIVCCLGMFFGVGGVLTQAALPYTARSLAMGNAGVALGSSALAGFANPANVHTVGSLGPNAQIPSVGFMAFLPRGLLSSLNDLSDKGIKTAEGVSSLLANNPVLTEEQMNQAVADLKGILDDGKNVFGKGVTARLDGLLASSLPFGFTVSLAHSRHYGVHIGEGPQAHLRALYDQLLQLKRGASPFPTAGLALDPNIVRALQVQTYAIQTTKFGVGYAHEFNIPGPFGSISAGLTGIYRNIRASYGDLDLGGLDPSKSLGFNGGGGDLFKTTVRRTINRPDATIGLSYALGFPAAGNLYVNLAMRNLFFHEERVGDMMLYHDFQTTLGLSYSFFGLAVGVDTDLLTERAPTIAGQRVGSDEKYVHLGMRYNLAGIAQFRLGQQLNLVSKDGEGTMTTAGIGFSFLFFHLDFSGGIGRGNYALATAFGINFPGW